MVGRTALQSALVLLGEVLESRELNYDLVVIGGAALLLRGVIDRPTLDLDALARLESGRWQKTKPLPRPLVAAVREVAEALDLPREPRDEKDWLNGGPTSLLTLGLPDGFEHRLEVLTYGGLTVRLPAVDDLITLKLWSATAASRGPRRAVDVADLRALAPTRSQLRSAIRWCRAKDGRRDYVELEVAPVLRELGHELSEVIDA